MNLKTWAPLGAAVVLGLVAAMVAKNSMSKPEIAARAPSESHIVTLKRDVAAGQEITAEDVTSSELSSPIAPPGTFTNVTEVIGRVTIAPMALGQPVLQPLLAPKGAAGGLQALIPNGMRAITIDVSETTSVGGMIGPGCLVDVLITLSGEAAGPTTKTLVQGVKVQAVGQRMGPPAKDAPPEQYRSVTLLVTPSQAETVELASNAGRPRLVLRSNNDIADANTAGISLAELRGSRGSNVDDLAATQQVLEHSPFSKPSTQPTVSPVTSSDSWDDIAPRRTTRRTVKVIKGGVQSTVTFETPRAPSGAVVDVPRDEVFAN